MKANKTAKGFHISRNEKQEQRKNITEKSNPTNKEIVVLLNQILEKLEGEK